MSTFARSNINLYTYTILLQYYLPKTESVTCIFIASSESKVSPITKKYEKILMTPNLLKYEYYNRKLQLYCTISDYDYFDEHNILMEFVPRLHRKLIFAHAAFH